ncbi:4Fe-4S binding protein [Methanolapillus millepedarum]|uniref:Pyruvate synthase subunit PorD n=1 Tax=Methanolapillus millepedarum TaxID=3028296 RepID=A0AA96ZW65_9EURY|nr:Pyruvate synthase subunit PorD [Methanosarcinaceae archaeon Ac7]
MKVTIGAVCDPGTAMENKTGGWRTFMPVFDYSKCIRCAICEVACPDMCIYPDPATANDKGKCLYKANYDYCKGCGICANECPKAVITMTLEEK